MPWCEDCSRYWALPTLVEHRRCPTCDRALIAQPRAPWHFKLLVVAAVGYLGLRAYQGVEWLLQR